MFSISRINPYSNGIRVELGSVGFGKLLVSLNPYSNGIRIELGSVDSRRLLVSLNPYSNGIRIERYFAYFL